jgi:hypothetical protein
MPSPHRIPAQNNAPRPGFNHAEPSGDPMQMLERFSKTKNRVGGASAAHRLFQVVPLKGI